MGIADQVDFAVILGRTQEPHRNGTGCVRGHVQVVKGVRSSEHPRKTATPQVGPIGNWVGNGAPFAKIFGTEVCRADDLDADFPVLVC